MAKTKVAGRSPGRPRFFTDPLGNHTVRMTDQQYRTFLGLGGSAWLRAQIDLNDPFRRSEGQTEGEIA